MFDSFAKLQVRILMLAGASALAGILAGCGGGNDDYQPPAPSPCAAKPPAADGGAVPPGGGCRRG